MRKFDMGAAWDDAVQLVRSHPALTVTIAAVFLFLPALAYAWFAPPPVEPPDGASAAELLRAFQQNMTGNLGGRLLLGVFSLIGSAAILRLWLARGGTSVGESLTFALTMIPTLLVVELLGGAAVALGLVLLILPGLYAIGRLAPAVALAVDQGVRNPIEALRSSVRLTEDNGWSIFVFLFLVTLVIGVVTVIANVTAMSLFGSESGSGKLVTGTIQALFGAAGSFVSLAVSAAIYRQLAVRGSAQLFD